MAPSKRDSAFILFVKEYRRANKTLVHFKVSIKECEKIWNGMTEHQRRPFIELKNRTKVELSSVDSEALEAVSQMHSMKETIEAVLEVGKTKGDLENINFIFVAFNYFVKTWNDVYCPAEFAACEFSLKAGQSNVYTVTINPGDCTFGWSSDALIYSSNSHQLPIPPHAMGEQDLVKVYDSIIEYCQKIHPDTKMPITLYTSTSLLPVVKSCLTYLARDAKDPDVANTFNICDIQYLFYALKKKTCNVAGIGDDDIKIYVTDEIFIRDPYEYASGISCPYHEEKDIGAYCVQSLVTRWCYGFADFMCKDLDIPIVPGTHTPPIFPSSGRSSKSYSKACPISRDKEWMCHSRPVLAADSAATDNHEHEAVKNEMERLHLQAEDPDK